MPLMSTNSSKEPTPPLIEALYETLTHLIQRPYPEVPNPENCKKRASVALILRVRSDYHHSHESCITKDDSPTHAVLSRFFDQSWVQQGDPEVVFIKRAAREGDRWTSHVALPGGKRDPDDEDDRAVAVRETAEEIGLDLTSPNCCFIGNLPQRVVSTSWGKVPIMVLCPFVFLWTDSQTPALRLQPNEVASTHWVPLRVLLSPSSRTFEYVDVSDRFASRGGALLKSAIRGVLGKMRFSAIQLIPSESLFCTSTTEFFPKETSEPQPKIPLSKRLYSWYLGDHASSSSKARPLLLWGLTLGILADFLDQLPPYNAIQIWKYPTFTSVDVRCIINLFTINLKRKNQEKLKKGQITNPTAVDSETVAIAPSGDNPWFIGGLSDGMKRRGVNATKSYAVGVMLEGYYDMARVGVWTAACLRLIGTISLAVYILRRFRLKRNT